MTFQFPQDRVVEQWGTSQEVFPDEDGGARGDS